MERHDFVEGVRRTARRHGMDLAGPLVLVSGGPDSVALLRAVLALGGEPAVLHVDHGLRGEESRADAAFVRSLCAGLGVRCEVRTLDLREGPGLQERAREGRYRLARQSADRFGLGVVATGHTADDVAETALLNLARGAGLRGLASIPPVREGLIRPLIDRTRREVIGYLSGLDQPYRTDATNLAPKYARNRVRLEVLRILEELHPGATSNIARAASLAREDLEALEELADTALEERATEVALSLEALARLPEALRSHAVRRACARALPGAPPPESRHVEAVLNLIEVGGPGTRRLDLPGGVVSVARGGDEVAFYVPGGAPGGEAPLEEGETAFGGWVFKVGEVRWYDGKDAARPGVAYLEPSAGPYHVRMAREGDMIRPLGLGGRKKVLRAMMDRKVPADRRRGTPVIVGRSGGVAWIPFGEIGEGFKVETGAEKVLKVEVAKTPWT